MPFPTAGLTTEYTSLRRNSYKVQQYISLCPNTVIQTSTISSIHQGGTNYAAFTLTDTVNADVEIGHTVIASTSATLDPAADVLGTFRVRRTPSSTNLPINETNTVINMTPRYAHILDDYRIQPKVGRIVGSTYYKDYDWVYSKPRPLINNLQSAYVGFISDTPVGDRLTISFAPSGVPVASGASIVSWLWDVGDGTIIVGGTTTQNITVRFPEGFRWITLTVTDSNGVAGWRRVPVWAHGSTFTPATGFNGATITGDWDNGYSARISGFNGIDKYLDETLCVIWRREWYGDTEEHIVNNVDFVGRLRNETIRAEGSLEHGVLVQDNEFVIEGPGQQLQRIAGPIIATFDTVAPTRWDEITNNTPGRTLAHILKEHTTFAELHDFSFGYTFGDNFRVLALGTSQNSVLAIVNDIAYSCINGGMEFSPDGASRVTNDARIRAGQITVPVHWLSIADQDLLSVSLDIEHSERYAKVDASSGEYNQSSRTVTPRAYTVPGAIGTSGDQIGSFHRQIINSSNVAGVNKIPFSTIVLLYLRNVLNSRYTLNVQLPDGYHFLIPSRNIRYQIRLSGDTNARGFDIAAGSQWLMKSISIIQDNELGAREVTAEFTGMSVRRGISDEPPDPVFPETPIEIPFDPAGVSQDGNTVVVWNEFGVWVTTGFKITDEPIWHTIKPGDSDPDTFIIGEQIIQCAWAYTTPRLYMMTVDTTVSRTRVWYKENGADLYEPFKPGAWLDTYQYEILRTTHEDEHLYVYRGTSNNRSRFSDDSGQTFSAEQSVGASGSSIAFDTIRIGSVTLAAYSGNVGIATTEAGSYSAYTTLSNVCGIYIPRYIFGSTTSDNINTTTPEYLAVTSTALNKVTNSGATITAITPNDGTNNGVGSIGSNENSLVMPWINGGKIAALLWFPVPTRKLAVSSDGGANWSITVVPNNGRAYIRMRRTDALANELYFSAGVPYYSPDFGTTIIEKSTPDGVNYTQGIEVYG